MASTVENRGPKSKIEPDPALGRVVGIDPGLNVTGYAVVEPTLRGPYVVEAGVIRPRGDSSPRRWTAVAPDPPGNPGSPRRFPASALALEQVHSHVKHPRTAILMAHARGVIVLAAAERGVPVVGYAASRIKKTLTGSGRAPKEQMQHAIRVELGLDQLPEPHDVADACAVALCHYPDLPEPSRASNGIDEGPSKSIRRSGIASPGRGASR